MRALTVKELLSQGSKRLKESGAGEFNLDAQLFMMKAAGLTKVQLFTKDDYILTEEETKDFEEMIKKREQKIPAQYILGECEFMNINFKVESGVLIPRADTEILVETILDYGKRHAINKIIDVGTGSGCIPISLGKFGIKELWAIDISDTALRVAAENAKNNNVNINFIKSDLFKEISDSFEGFFDAVVSNPPYIETGVIPSLMEEVKNHEPFSALDGGEDGLDFYRAIVKDGKRFLKEKGWMFFEIGFNQGEAVSFLLREEGFINIEIIKDLAGMDRVVLGMKS